jgi:hypothetical protein
MRFVFTGRKTLDVRREFSSSAIRHAGRALCTICGVALVLVIAPVAAGRSQVPGQNVGGPGNYKPYYPGPQTPMDTTDGYDQVAMERRLNALNMERQKEMVSDTNKLLKLAKELNEEVAANNTTTLSLDQLHKIAEIEKLARGVKDKMANGVGRPSTPVEPPLLIPAR